MSSISWGSFMNKPGNSDVLVMVGYDYIRQSALLRRFYIWLNRPVTLTTDAVITVRVGNQILRENVEGSTKAGTSLFHYRERLVAARSDIPTNKDCADRRRFFDLNNSQNWTYFQVLATRPVTIWPDRTRAIGAITAFPTPISSAFLSCSAGGGPP